MFQGSCELIGYMYYIIMMSLQEEGFSLYLIYLKALPQGKKVLSEFGGNFFEVYTFV